MACGNVSTILSKFEFKWVVDKFCLRCYKVGEYLKSPKFRTYCPVSGQIEWYLLLYPNGDDVYSEKHLSIYLRAITDKIKAKTVFKFLDRKGKIVHSWGLEESVFGKKSWGCSACLSRDFIMDPANRMLLDGNKITIVCEINLEVDDKEAEKLNKKQLQEQEVDVLAPYSVIDKFEALFNDDDRFSDVSLVSEGKAVKAHKCILAKSSTVFTAMFEAEMKEKKENIVEIDDMTYDVLVEMVRYIYTGRVRNFDTLAGELAYAADKYALDELKNMCEKMITDNLCLDNVFDCLQLAIKIHMDRLKQKAMDFIVEKGSDAFERPEYESLPSDIMCAVSRAFARKVKIV